MSEGVCTGNRSGSCGLRDSYDQMPESTDFGIQGQLLNRLCLSVFVCSVHVLSLSTGWTWAWSCSTLTSVRLSDLAQYFSLKMHSCLHSWLRTDGP